MSSPNQRFETVNLPGGKCLIMEQKKDGTCYRSLTRSNKSCDIMDKMWNQEVLCDVTLVSDQTEVRAHKLVLAASSVFFYSMFSEITRKSIIKNDDRIALNGIHHVALDAILRYFYNAELLVTKGNVEYLLRAAKLFVLNDVFNACCHFLESQLNTSNCLSLASFAREQECPQLISSTDAFIRKHFCDVVKSEDFLNLPKQRIFELMESNKSNTPDQMNVFTALVAWVKHNIESRQKYFAALMEFVQFHLISLQNLIEHVQEEPLIDYNLKCRTYVKEAMKYHMSKDNQKSKMISNPKPAPSSPLVAKISSSTKFTITPSTIIQMTTPRTNPMPTIIAPMTTPRSNPIPGASMRITNVNSKQTVQKVKALVAVGVDIYYSLAIQRYDSNKKRWSICSKSFEKNWREGSTLLITEKNVYMLGGTNIDQCQKVDIYDLGLHNWLESRPLLEGRSCPAAASVNGDIYVSGGLATNGSWLKECEKFDQKTGQWMKLGNMKFERSGHSMSVMDGKIYAIGGWNGKQVLSSVELYYPKKNSWTRILDMIRQRLCPGVVAYDHKLYVLGGSDGRNYLKSVEVFDPVLNTWTKLADMNCERYGSGVVARKSRIYVIGGWDGKNELGTVEVYNVISNTWTLLPEKMCKSCSPAYAAFVEQLP